MSKRCGGFRFGVPSLFVADCFFIPSHKHDFRFQESSLQQHQISDAARKRKCIRFQRVRPPTAIEVPFGFDLGGSNGNLSLVHDNAALTCTPLANPTWTVSATDLHRFTARPIQRQCVENSCSNYLDAGRSLLFQCHVALGRQQWLCARFTNSASAGRVGTASPLGNSLLLKRATPSAGRNSKFPAHRIVTHIPRSVEARFELGKEEVSSGYSNVTVRSERRALHLVGTQKCDLTAGAVAFTIHNCHLCDSYSTIPSPLSVPRGVAGVALRAPPPSPPVCSCQTRTSHLLMTAPADLAMGKSRTRFIAVRSVN
ncbi:hypothetical protein J6590_035374 [Homalodisca vitripennis]|nr:hypothetical protein J6590_035374 [Homalodisca vitripennis]